MASSGSITTNSYQNRSLTLSWSLASQSVEGNYSVINWALKGSGSASSWYMSGNFKAVINGTTVYSSSTRIKLKNGTSVASGSLRINHNSNGSKSFSLSCQAGIYNVAVNCTASGTHTLNTIPRASSISAGNVTLGNETSITVSRASSSFTHTLSYTFGSESGTIITKTADTNVTWTPPVTLANQIPNAASGVCTITCTTYNGSSAIGSKACSITLFVPDDVKPTLESITAERIDGDVPSSWGIYVKTKSKALLSINGAAGAYGSSISSYSIEGGGYSGTDETLTTGFLNNSGVITFTARVTDSRGRTSDPKSIEITVEDYAMPGINSYSTQRCISDGTLADDGSYGKCTVDYSYAACAGKNHVTGSIFYKKASESEWIDAKATFESQVPSVFGGGLISAEYSYDIKYTIEDAFTKVTVTDELSTAAVVMDFMAGGNGIAFGKVSETDKCLEISENWDFKLYGKLMRQYLLDAVYPVGSVYLSITETNPSELFGGSWVQFGAGRTLVGVNTDDTDFSEAEKTGGEKTHTLTVSEMPSHLHGYAVYSSTGNSVSGYGHLAQYAGKNKGWSSNTANAGGSGAHNNLQPYITCYMWKRTA